MDSIKSPEPFALVVFRMGAPPSRLRRMACWLRGCRWELDPLYAIGGASVGFGCQRCDLRRVLLPQARLRAMDGGGWYVVGEPTVRVVDRWEGERS